MYYLILNLRLRHSECDTWPLLNVPWGRGVALTECSNKEQRRGSASCKQLTLKKKSGKSELIELHMLDLAPKSHAEEGGRG